jgi:hypothetical protein
VDILSLTRATSSSDRSFRTPESKDLFNTIRGLGEDPKVAAAGATYSSRLKRCETQTDDVEIAPAAQATENDVRSDVGYWCGSGLVLLTMRFVGRDP